MNSFYSPLLFLHIGAGFTALLTGLIAIISKKGQKNHRLNGKIYFWSMLAVAVSAVVMSLVKDIDFFLMIAWFSFYSTYTGYRAIRNKTRQPNGLDWLMLFGSVVTLSFMIFSGNIILIVFGVLFSTQVVVDVKDYLREEPLAIKSKAWLITHIGRMLGSYIATITAFLVVNLGDLLYGNWQLLVWLGPAIIGAPLIIYWIIKYNSGLKKRISPI